MNQFKTFMYNFKEDLTNLGIKVRYGTIFTGYLESDNCISIHFDSKSDMHLFELTHKDYYYGRYNHKVQFKCAVWLTRLHLEQEPNYVIRNLTMSLSLKMEEDLRADLDSLGIIPDMVITTVWGDMCTIIFKSIDDMNLYKVTCKDLYHGNTKVHVNFKVTE